MIANLDLFHLLASCGIVTCLYFIGLWIISIETKIDRLLEFFEDEEEDEK